MKSIFLSHSSEDKEFARALHNTLNKSGIKSWIDEAEIRIGDSLIEKISEGINKADYVAIILSPRSINSNWCKKELEIAMTQEVKLGRKKILPILIENCKIPSFIEDKVYGDCRDATNTLKTIEKIKEMLKEESDPDNIKKNKKTSVKKQVEQVPPEIKKKNFERYKEIYDIATAPSYREGMELSQIDALKIAKFFSEKQAKSFDKFKEIYDIATAPSYRGGDGVKPN